MTLRYTKLSRTLGAEVHDLDLASASPEELKALYDLWIQYHVLVLRDQPLDESQLIEFGRNFGTIEKARKRSALADHEEIMVISNIRADGEPQGALPDGELYWHFDRIHQQVPNKAGVLHAIEVPSQGGDTRFADMSAAYEALPETLKQKINGLRALNTYQYGQTQAENKQLADDSPRAMHPLVRIIPETGKPALYVCRLMTDCIEGLPESESQALLEELFDHCERPEFTFDHQWQTADTLIWDNRCVMHARTDFPADQRRLLKRVTVGDTVAPVPQS